MGQWTTGDTITADIMNMLCEVGVDTDKGLPGVEGQAFFATDTLKLYLSSNGSTWDNIINMNGLCLFSRPDRLYASDGTTLKQLNHAAYSYQNSAADGDRMQLEFYARGTETKLCLGCSKTSTSGKFDLYINGNLDTSAYDNYAASPADLHRYITLTQPINPGYNLIELRVNGTTGAAYVLNVYGASLQ